MKDFSEDDFAAIVAIDMCNLDYRSSTYVLLTISQFPSMRAR